MQARLPATARHTRSPPRATLTLRHARQVLCRATALFGRADLLPRAARRRRAPHRLDLPPVCPSPRALHFTCAHVTLRRPTASHASQESTRMLRARAHARMRARATASRASPARDHLYPRVHVVLQVSTLPASSQPPNQNARFGQDRDQELRAGPRKSEPSPSPARRARASRAHASPGAVSSMPCTDTKVRVYCTVCGLTHACATSCIIQRDTTTV